jgi:hypothetical protein
VELEKLTGKDTLTNPLIKLISAVLVLPAIKKVPVKKKIMKKIKIKTRIGGKNEF